VEVKVILWPTVSLPVCPGIKPSSGTRDQFFFFLKISLDSCGFVVMVRTLTRGRVCKLQLLLGLSRAGPHRSAFGETHEQILFCKVRDSPFLECNGALVYFLQQQVSPVMPTSIGFAWFIYMLCCAGVCSLYLISPRRPKYKLSLPLLMCL
jgi:hypothetical protein